MFWIIVIGLLAGMAAKALMPGPIPGGIFATVMLGVGGALLANLVGGAVGFYERNEFYSVLSATVGAMAILYVYAALTRTKRMNSR